MTSEDAADYIKRSIQRDKDAMAEAEDAKRKYLADQAERIARINALMKDHVAPELALIARSLGPDISLVVDPIAKSQGAPHIFFRFDEGMKFNSNRSKGSPEFILSGINGSPRLEARSSGGSPPIFLPTATLEEFEADPKAATNQIVKAAFDFIRNGKPSRD